MNHTRKAKRRNIRGVAVDQCLEPKARGKRDLGLDRETNGGKEVGLVIGEIGRGRGAEAEIEEDTEAEVVREKGVGPEAGREDEVEATGEVDTSQGQSPLRRARR